MSKKLVLGLSLLFSVITINLHADVKPTPPSQNPVGLHLRSSGMQFMAHISEHLKCAELLSPLNPNTQQPNISRNVLRDFRDYKELFQKNKPEQMSPQEYQKALDKMEVFEHLLTGKTYDELVLRDKYVFRGEQIQDFLRISERKLSEYDQLNPERAKELSEYWSKIRSRNEYDKHNRGLKISSGFMLATSIFSINSALQNHGFQLEHFSPLIFLPGMLVDYYKMQKSKLNLPKDEFKPDMWLGDRFGEVTNQDKVQYDHGGYLLRPILGLLASSQFRVNQTTESLEYLVRLYDDYDLEKEKFIKTNSLDKNRPFSNDIKLISEIFNQPFEVVEKIYTKNPFYMKYYFLSYEDPQTHEPVFILLTTHQYFSNGDSKPPSPDQKVNTEKKKKEDSLRGFAPGMG